MSINAHGNNTTETVNSSTVVSSTFHDDQDAPKFFLNTTPNPRTPGEFDDLYQEDIWCTLGPCSCACCCEPAAAWRSSLCICCSKKFEQVGLLFQDRGLEVKFQRDIKLGSSRLAFIGVVLAVVWGIAMAVGSQYKILSVGPFYFSMTLIALDCSVPFIIFCCGFACNRRFLGQFVFTSTWIGAMNLPTLTSLWGIFPYDCANITATSSNESALALHYERCGRVYGGTVMTPLTILFALQLVMIIADVVSSRLLFGLVLIHVLLDIDVALVSTFWNFQLGVISWQDAGAVGRPRVGRHAGVERPE